MAGTGGRTTAAIADQLRSDPQQFNFYQAVRLLEWMHAETLLGDERGHVGADAPPTEEAVRFRAQVSLAFPASAIVDLNEAEGEQAPVMTVSFFGMHGPMGALPRHYTLHLLERCHVRHRDYAFRDFLDTFNHRAISLYYRAWEKYHFGIDYERSKRRKSREDDLFTYCLLCLVGLGTAGLAERLQNDKQTIVYYGGHFARQAHNATSLAVILQDYFGLPMIVNQFQGQWLYMSEDDQSSLPSLGEPLGRNCALGTSVVVGERVWDVQSRFRVRVGPLTYAQFRRLTPNGDMLAPLFELARLYVGTDLDFDVQLVLLAAEVPGCRLAGDGSFEPRLGWNTWAINDVMRHDACDAVFVSP